MKLSPRILLINVFFSPNRYGGATVLSEDIARVLMREHSAHVTAISAISRQDLVPYAVVRTYVNGIDSYLINMPEGRTFRQGYANSEVDRLIAKIAKIEAPDFAHIHCVQDLGAGCLPALHKMGVPVVLSTHDYWWICERQFMMAPEGQPCGRLPRHAKDCAGCVADLDRTRSRRAALFEAADHAAFVTCPSRAALRLYQACGFAPGKLRLWENGIKRPGDDFPHIRGTRRAQDTQVRFGYFGGPSLMKGWPVLEAALRGLPRRDFGGILIDGSLNGDWWRGYDLSRLPGAWQILPRFEPEDLDRVFAGIDVLLFPSQWPETFGLVVREALARGIAVIQTDAGGAAEHTGHALANILPKSASAREWQRAISAAIDAPPEVPNPQTMRSVEEQAADFMKMVEPVLTASRHLKAGA